MPVNSDNIHIGRGDLYVGVTVPETPPVPLNENGEPATGTFIGATLEGANFIYRPTTVDVYTQQSGVLAISVMNTEDLSLEFTIGEITFDNLKRFLLGAAGTENHITVGGNVIPATTSLLLVAPRRDGNFIEAMIYNAFFPGDRSVPFAREGVSMVRVTARGLGVFTRDRGDQLGFFRPVVVPE